MRNLTFGDVIFITNISRNDSDGADPSIRIVEIEGIKSVEEYSRFVLVSLKAYIRTPYVLLIQWDGYVVDPSAWSDAFYCFDYIGATWLQKDGTKIVGNGGFSLRSRKLLEAMSSQEITLHHPEDDCIAKTNRTVLEDRYGIHFADPATADRFSYEFDAPGIAVFGFHGFCNFPDVMLPEDLHQFVHNMPSELVFSGYFPGFLERLHQKAKSGYPYDQSLEQIVKIILDVFSKADISGHVPGKSLIKSLIRLRMDSLAKAAIKTRIAASGYSATNIRLVARLLGQRLRLGN
jgi:hypothetical protein